MLRSLISIFRVCGLTGLAFSLAAQQAPPTPPPANELESELLALLNTPVKGASKREQRLIESPQAIEVLTGEEIRQMGIFRIQDALKLMTGIDILETDNGFSVVGMRGVMQQGQPRTVQVLIDGVPLYNAFASSIDINNLPVPIDVIDRMEIVRGPSSTLYGANAVVGVIAITTKRAGDGVKGDLRAARADKQTSRWNGVLNLGNGDFGVTAGVGGASLGNSGETVYQVGDVNHVSPYVLDEHGLSNSSHQSSAYARLDWKNAHTSIWFSAGDAHKKLGQTQQLLNRWFQVDTLLGGWRETWSPVFSTELRAHLVNQKFTFHMDDAFASQYRGARQALGLSDVDISGDYNFGDNTSTQVEVQANWDPSKELHFVLGADSRKVSSKKVVFLGINQDDKESASGGFLTVDWTFVPQWTLSLGARAENETLGGSRTSPRATLVWTPTPTSVVRAGFYTSTRSPQLTEQRLNYTFPYRPNPASPATVVFQIAANDQLQPEKTSNFELGYRQSLGTFTLDLTLYQMAIKKQISQVIVSSVQPAPGLTMIGAQFQNKGDATNKGVELALTWAIKKDWQAGMNGRYLSYSQDDAGNGSAFLGSEFSYAPKHIVSAWTRFTHGSFRGYLDVQHVASAKVEALTATGVTLFDERPDYFQCDLQLGYELVKGLVLGVYARNAAREFTLQGATGPERPPYFQSARREMGASLAYHF